MPMGMCRVDPISEWSRSLMSRTRRNAISRESLLPRYPACGEAPRHHRFSPEPWSYNITFDAHYISMRQKRVQGSHFTHLRSSAATGSCSIAASTP